MLSLIQTSSTQTVRAGTVILQIVATFGLIWAATAGFLFREMRNMKTSKIDELRNPDEPLTSHRSEMIIFLTTVAVWSSGLVLTVITYIAIASLTSHLPRRLSMGYYFLATLVAGGVIIVISTTVQRIRNLQKLELLTGRRNLWNIAIGVIIVLSSGLFIALFTEAFLSKY